MRMISTILISAPAILLLFALDGLVAADKVTVPPNDGNRTSHMDVPWRLVPAIVSENKNPGTAPREINSGGDIHLPNEILSTEDVITIFLGTKFSQCILVDGDNEKSVFCQNTDGILVRVIRIQENPPASAIQDGFKKKQEILLNF